MNEWVIKMTNAKSRAERACVVDEYAKLLGASKSFVYKKLKEDGYETRREERKDKGKKNIDESTLKLLSGVIKSGIRENGKKTMPLGLAKDILVKNGYDVPLSESRLREILKEAKLDAESLQKERHNERLRSLYPNHVHQADPSVALIYFDPESKKTAKIIQDSEYYKNKDFFNDDKNKRKKCLRYVLTDHYSGSICVRYYSGYGEAAEYMYDFLLYAWGKKNVEGYSFHGVPELLLWDKGSANTSKAVTNALRSLGVKVITHATGKSRVKGQVENANNIVETHVESLLRLENVKTIEELNDIAEKFCVNWNTNQIIRRMGVAIGTRHDLWIRIKKENLHELPDTELCRQIFTRGVEVRKVKSDLTINVYHPKAKRTLVYSLSGLGIDSGETVNAEALLIGTSLNVLVWMKQGRDEVSYEVKPIEIDEAGFDVNAAVIGAEYRVSARTESETQNDEMTDLSNSLQKDGNLKTHSLMEMPDYVRFIKEKEGKAIALENTHEILLSSVEAVKKVRARIGYVPDDLTDSLKRDYPGGVPFGYVEEICDFYEHKESEKREKDNIS